MYKNNTCFNFLKYEFWIYTTLSSSLEFESAEEKVEEKQEKGIEFVNSLHENVHQLTPYNPILHLLSTKN